MLPSLEACELAANARVNRKRLERTCLVYWKGEKAIREVFRGASRRQSCRQGVDVGGGSQLPRLSPKLRREGWIRNWTIMEMYGRWSESSHSGLQPGIEWRVWVALGCQDSSEAPPCFPSFSRQTWTLLTFQIASFSSNSKAQVKTRH